MALTRFTEKLKQDLKINVERDNRSELHKIFMLYQRLDKLDEGVQEYLHTVVRQFMVQFKLLEKCPPVCTGTDPGVFPELEKFF